MAISNLRAASRRFLVLGMVIMVCMLTGCQQMTPMESVDKSALDYLKSQGNADAQTAANALQSILNDRKEESIDTEDTESQEPDSQEPDSQKPDTDVIPQEEHLSPESIRDFLASGQKGDGILSPGKVSSLAESQLPALRSLYSDTIILGNSRARSILDSGLLTQNEVLFKWAAHVDEMMDVTVQAANLHRGKTLFIMGVNDLGYYCANTEGFKRDYIALIDAYRAINPDSEIYLQEIIPINEAYRFRWKNMDRVTAYNEIIREICEEKDCTFVTSVRYALPEFLRDDGTGAHYNRQYHIYWAQTMANQMQLWEDQP